MNASVNPQQYRGHRRLAMAKAILRKAVSDLRSRPLQSALMFLVIAAAATSFSLALTIQQSVGEPYDRLARESNAAHVWLQTNQPEVAEEAVRSMPGVEAVGEPLPISWAGFAIRNGERKVELGLVGMTADLPDFDHPVVTNGRWLSAGVENELVLDRGAALRLGLKAGQAVDLLTVDGPRPFTVVGFAVPTGRAPVPIEEEAFAYVLPSTLSRLDPAPQSRSMRIGIELADPNATGAFLQEVRPHLGEEFDAKTWQGVRDKIKEASLFDIVFLQVFSLFALLAAGLIIANAVGGQVLAQVRDVGILKAIGFTPRQVSLTLLVQNVVLSLLASAAGLVLALFASRFFLERTAEILGVTAAPAVDPSLVTISVVVVVIIVVLFTLVPAWRAGRLGAIEALRSGERQATGSSRLAGLAARLRLPGIAIVGLKDVFRRPGRTAMTIAALVVAVVTATFALSFEATIEQTMQDPTVIGGPPFDLGVDRDIFSPTEAKLILDARPEIDHYLTRYDAAARIDRYEFELRGFDGDLSKEPWRLREGQMPSRPGEVLVSQTIASDLGVAVGDGIQAVVSAPEGERTLDLVVVGRYVDVDGEVMMVTRDTLPSSALPTDYLIKVRPGVNGRQLANALIADSGGILDPEVIAESVREVRGQIRPVMFGLNAILLFIAGINLLSSLLLTVRERRRDFAILKTIGFTPGQIAASVFTSSLLLASIALAFGLPLGLVASRVVFDFLSSSAGIGTGIGQLPGITWLALLVPGAIVMAVLGTLLPARRAALVQVAEALRLE